MVEKVKAAAQGQKISKVFDSIAENGTPETSAEIAEDGEVAYVLQPKVQTQAKVIIYNAVYNSLIKIIGQVYQRWVSKPGCRLERLAV